MRHDTPLRRRCSSPAGCGCRPGSRGHGPARGGRASAGGAHTPARVRTAPRPRCSRRSSPRGPPRCSCGSTRPGSVGRGSSGATGARRDRRRRVPARRADLVAGACVELAPKPIGQARVGPVANQRVVEDEIRPVAVEKAVDTRPGVVGLVGNVVHDCLQHLVGERLPEDRGASQQGPVAWFQTIDPGGDESLERIGERMQLPGGSCREQLGEEERVAARRVRSGRRARGGQAVPLPSPRAPMPPPRRLPGAPSAAWSRRHPSARGREARRER